ncbi:DUF1156 domain-containing protein [Legionella sainthelensi]|uniref:DUF1156 domain-containing protein n=1 Tax=Legionella sainthelensi TaxID=28087 RepID=UPI000E20B2C7|nr:DUF1156 domain-containing protein [Legionella sainthelensi]
MTIIKVPKKLIEVALPLDAINAACAYEKMPGIGPHPRGIHLWWARRPLAAARAIIFAQMVNDPGYERDLGRGLNKEKADIERTRLFKIIERLVDWKNLNNENLLNEAREEIWKSWRETCDLNKHHPQAAELFDPEKLPAFHDPFAGGGAIPLEAQRLGLESHAADLNPVAVTINKAMIEIPAKFSGRIPVGPLHEKHAQTTNKKALYFVEDWSGAKGLSEDIKRYGFWVNKCAIQRIAHLYPKIEITSEMVSERPDLTSMVGEKLTVIAWLWTRTVKSPNPIFSHVEVPLASTFILSKKKGKEAFVKPVIEGSSYSFKVQVGSSSCFDAAKNGTKSGGSGSSFVCLLSQTIMDFKYLRDEAKNGRMGQRLMAIVAEGKKGRVYLAPNAEHEIIAKSACPNWEPDTKLPDKALGFRVQEYGMLTWKDIYTPRQLMALGTLSDLVKEVIPKIRQDALNAGMNNDDIGLAQGGVGATAYSEAIALYLAFGIDRCADFSNTCTRWVSGNEKIMNLYGKQAIAMTWDFPEAAILHNTVGGFEPAINYIADCVLKLVEKPLQAFAVQQDAATSKLAFNKVISTDPPYYDNIGYADLSDFFYVWLRRLLKPIFPKLYATMLVPKAEELVATPFRHGTKEKAEAFFLNGMTHAMHNLVGQAHPAFPVSIYYAFKQSETIASTGTSSTGWETFLEAVLSSGFALTGTWPIRSEQSARLVGKGTNALASSIVLVCRKRPIDAPIGSRREFIRELNAFLPQALLNMTLGGDNSPVAPVDLSQAIIGPGMAIFSKYSRVLETDGKPMSVRTALQLINRFLSEDDFDHDTQFCLQWFETYGWVDGKFGEADVLARAKGTSVNGLQNSGVIQSLGGNLCLLRWHEYSPDWSPEKDNRTPVWEALHQLIRALNQNGEFEAGKLLARMPERFESIRALAYRLYTLCERKGWAEDARAYNEIINSWAGIEKSSYEVGHLGSQTQFNFEV